MTGKKKWAAETNGYEWFIRYDANPDGTKNADGSTTYTLSFRALKLTDLVDEPERVAGEIADELNERSTLLALVQEMGKALEELLGAYSEPDRRLCCDGRDCGCMGSTVHQQAEHYANTALASFTAFMEGQDNALRALSAQEEGK